MGKLLIIIGKNLRRKIRVLALVVVGLNINIEIRIIRDPIEFWSINLRVRINLGDSLRPNFVFQEVHAMRFWLKTKLTLKIMALWWQVVWVKMVRF